MSRVIYGPEEIARGLVSLAAAMAAAHRQEPVLIGIRRGGLVLSDRLAELLDQSQGRRPAQGVIDINLYRDDWTRARELPRVGKTDIPWGLDDKRVILVDDVLFTGRTVRAALEALNDFGRPARIELAALVDRGHREMPVQADYVAFKMSTTLAQRVNVYFKGQDGRAEDLVVLEE
jgi:pyrimidine operon attenuation protein/uracil phosphoribosyltransferase